MGLLIGEGARASWSLGGVQQFQFSRGRDATAGSRLGSTAERGTDLFARNETPAPRVGFGEGTISPLGVAFDTIDTNLAAARELVPSLEEAAAEARARVAENRRDLTAAPREQVQFSPPNFQRNEAFARAQARTFINNISAGVARVAERTGFEIPGQGLDQPSIRIRDEIVALRRPEPNPTFDVFA